MGAKQSDAMSRAKVMVIGGATPYAAAKAVGITRNAIYMAPWYKDWRDAKKKLQG